MRWGKITQAIIVCLHKDRRRCNGWNGRVTESVTVLRVQHYLIHWPLWWQHPDLPDPTRNLQGFHTTAACWIWEANRDGGKEGRRERERKWACHTPLKWDSKWRKVIILKSTYNAAGAAPGLPLLPKRPAKNCCTILGRVETDSKDVHFETNALLECLFCVPGVKSEDVHTFTL